MRYSLLVKKDSTDLKIPQQLKRIFFRISSCLNYGWLHAGTQNRSQEVREAACDESQPRACMQPLKSLELIRLKLLHAVNYCHALVLLLWLTGLITRTEGVPWLVRFLN